MVVQRFVGVYDADHTLRGELAYLVKARLGKAHCGLCEITHGALREKAGWQACRASLPAPFETFHRSDQPAEARAASGGRLPVVLAETDAGWRVLLDAAAIDACAGAGERLVEELLAAVEREGLTLPEA